MRKDFPGISTRDRNAYTALWRAENRQHVTDYNRDYQRKRRRRLKRLAAKNGNKAVLKNGHRPR